MYKTVFALKGTARQVFSLLRLLATKRGELTLKDLLPDKGFDESTALNELRREEE